MTLPTDFEITSHRPLMGRFIVAYKKLVRLLIAPYLKNVFEMEHRIIARQVDELGRPLDGRVNQKVSEFDAILDENQRRMTDIFGSMVETSRTQLDEKIVFFKDRLMEHLQELDKRLMEMNSTMIKQFQSIDERFSLASQKMDGLMDEHLQTMSNNMGALISENRSALDEKVTFFKDSLMEHIRDFDEKIIDYRKDLDERFISINATMMEKFKWIDEHFQLATRKMDEIFKHTDTLYQTVDQKTENLAVRQDAVDWHLSSLKDASEALQARFEEAERDFTHGKDALQKTIEEIKERQDSVDGNLPGLKEATEELRARFEEAERDFNYGKDELQKTIEEIKERQTELKGDLVSGREEAERGKNELVRSFREMDLDMTLQKRRLDKILSELRKKAGLDKASMKKLSGIKDHIEDHFYFLFENRFRGSSEDIKKRQEVYLPIFLSSLKNAGNAPVLDVGCGRGELLELFNENNIPAMGVDMNEEMVVVCREKGLEVEEADALAYLKGIKDNTLGGIIACQVIEHLPAPVLAELVKLCHEKVCTGGPVVFETINPESLYAMKWFYMDMTHQKPVHPQAISFMMESAGFHTIEIKYLSPVPEDLRLNSGSDENLRKIDNLLFGPQDYAVIATR